MSTQITGFQPFIFNEQLDCPSCGLNDYQIVYDDGDQIFVQFKVNTCDDALVPFDVFVNEWEADGGTICSNNNDGGTYILSYKPEFLYGVYVLRFNVPTYISGVLTVTVNGGNSFDITAPGTYELVFTTLAAWLSFQVDFTFSGTFEGCFNGIEVFGVRNGHRFAIVNIDDNGNPTDVAYTGTVQGADFGQLNGEYLTIGYDFRNADLNGCYRIGMADPCENTCGQFGLKNMYFNVEGGWEQQSPGPNTFVIEPLLNEMQITITDVTVLIIKNDQPICAGVEYEYEIEVADITGSISLSFDFGAVSVPIASAGTYTGTVTANGTEVLIIVQPGVFSGSIVIKKVVLRATSFQFDQFSNIFSVKPLADEEFCKTVLIEGCCGEDQFNIKFNGTNFLPTLRLEKRFFRLGYDTDVEVFRGFDGTNQTSYADIQKRKTLRLERLPEFIVDFLATAVYYDNFFINGTPFALAEPEFPEPIANDAYDLYDLELILKQKHGKIRKVQCTGTDASCLPNFFNNVPESLIYENGVRILMENGENTELEG